MKESKRNVVFWVFALLLVCLVGVFTIFYFIKPGFFTSSDKILHIGVSAVFLVTVGLIANELLHWRKQGKRSDAFDLVLIVFIFITIFLATFEVFISVIGAFGIFIIFGAYELREYEVLNKLLIITAVTYNVIFVAGLVNFIMFEFGADFVTASDDSISWIIRDAAFSFSIWIILILGFALFGRKYLVVLRFMSPEYLTMFLYILAWLAVRTSSLIWAGALNAKVQRYIIYAALFVTNWIVYAISGPILDWMLGIKRVSKQIDKIDSQLATETDKEKIKVLRLEKKKYLQLQSLVDEVSQKVNIKRPVKVGFAKYPILNAMAYGAFFDKRIAIISSDITEISPDELRGIIGHELHHAKGLDTLILSAMSSLQLIIFCLIPNWPATYFDYVFSEAKEDFLPIWVFILINLAITIIIYVFIRMLEGRADRRTRESGFGNELAKGLYNLEGFYSSGREIGLDTMLLSEEQIIEYNKVDNYSTTAQYLDRNMTNPKPMTLLSNLMNSHPPSYLRILAMYDEKDQIKPARESILPFILIGKKQRLKYAKNMKNARNKYREMANAKFKSMFGIENYAAYLNYQKKKEVYEVMMGKTYLHVDEKNFTLGMGVMRDLQIHDEVCEPFSYLFSPIEVKYPTSESENVDSQELIQYNTTHISENTYTIPEDISKLKQLEFGALYQLTKTKNAILVAVKIDPELKIKVAELSREVDSLNNSYKLFKKYLRQYIRYYFVDEEGQLIVKKWRFKPKFNLNTIKDAQGKEIFLQERGTLQLLRLKEINTNESKFDFTLECEYLDGEKKVSYPLKKILVKKEEFGLHFHNENDDFIDEIKILNYLKENQTRTTIYLKKAVNNVETGYISSVTYDPKNPKQNSFLVLKNTHNNTIEIPLQKIETMVFSYRTIGIQNKSKMSVAERFMQKVLYWTQPDQIYYP